MTTKVYECKNTACTLGTPKTPGRFSGGATRKQITNLTGDPTPEKHGEGVCPNCGEPGTEVPNVPPPHEGTDPYARHHKAIQARVESEEDKLTADDAQEAFEELVGEKAIRVPGDDDDE